ncbi:hypothetical protein FraEuI1c_2751 [Pseudofrankia inefficax]|uniref:Uncharacterized protein n=1 Tax=Pseudofrankia inefficax (strain DSM 45817 / CECT 9037 / DDB 130130 / EuI1c) TaxID=298654 RepID=E3J6K3_PSEI1|nr:hypothetical protein FraEuI1c_2751 [Pseudofrankia inefficax]
MGKAEGQIVLITGVAWRQAAGWRSVGGVGAPIIAADTCAPIGNGRHPLATPVDLASVVKEVSGHALGASRPQRMRDAR